MSTEIWLACVPACEYTYICSLLKIIIYNLGLKEMFDFSQINLGVSFRWLHDVSKRKLGKAQTAVIPD